MARKVSNLVYGEEEWHDAQEEQQHDARINLVLVSEAIRRNTAKWIVPGNDFKDPFIFLDSAKDEVEKIVTDVNGHKKVNTTLVCVM